MTYVPKTWVDGECLFAADLNAMEAGTDRAQGDVMKPYGPTAGLPVTDPLLEGRLYFESDLLRRVWRDNGAGWDDVTPFGGNGLLNNLIAYWPGNEVAGNALDLHANALHLTDTNTVTSNPGLVYPLARQYTRANLEYHTRPGDDALLSTGAGVDFTLASWFRLDGPAGTKGIASKWQGGAAVEYGLYTQADNTLTWTLPLANRTKVIVVATWYLAIGWYDSVAARIYLQLNNDVPASIACAAPADTVAAFRIGSITLANFMNGRIAPTMFWKSAGGAGGVLTAAQRTALYNGGAGLAYAAVTV